ncbi:hypothetical protein D3C73_00810 [compost metagenome]
MNYGRADIAIGVIDVGSPKGGKLGWAILAPNGAPVLGKDLDVFIDAITALGAHWPLAMVEPSQGHEKIDPARRNPTVEPQRIGLLRAVS